MTTEAPVKPAVMYEPPHVPYEKFDIRLRWNKYIPHAPHTKQHAFLWLDQIGVEDAMFGGQAGGGKSDALLMSALQWVDEPGYAALILRKSYPDLAKPGAIMSRAKEWLAPTDAKWNENSKEFTFPSGAKLEFGYLKRDDDVFQYQSAEYQFIGFDELTQFTEFQYTYMKSRLRRLKGARVPLRVRSATNPGGKGHQWVRRYFIKPSTKENRVFIPSAIDDNPSLDQEAYKKSLEHLDPYTKAQLLYGDWSARPPGAWAIDHEHLDAVFTLGREMRLKYEAGELPPPVDGVGNLGADFGEFSHIVFGYPLEMSGYFIPFEHVYEKGEPDRESKDFLMKLDRFNEWSPEVYIGVNRSRFDSSKPESMRLFYRTMRDERGPGFGKPSPIAFNKYKRQAILQFRSMASRTAWGETYGRMAIDPVHNPVLESQFYELQYKTDREGDDTEDLVKKDDHGPDAVFALLAPEIKTWSPPEDKPEHVREQEEKKHAEKVEALASG